MATSRKPARWVAVAVAVAVPETRRSDNLPIMGWVRLVIMAKGNWVSGERFKS